MKEQTYIQAFISDIYNGLDAVQLSQVQGIQVRTGQSFKTRYILQLLIPLDIHPADTRASLIQMMKKSRDFLKNNPTYAILIKVILAQYQRRLTV